MCNCNDDTIDTKTIDYGEGLYVRIDVILDYDSTPYDADCYLPEDIERWKNDDWHYVGYTYTVFDSDDTTLGFAAIWGCEWGFGDAYSTIDDWIREDYYHPDLMDEAIGLARASRERMK